MAAGAAGIGFFRPGDPERSAFRERAPKLGTGKIDYMALRAMMESQPATDENSPAMV